MHFSCSLPHHRQYCGLTPPLGRGRQVAAVHMHHYGAAGGESSSVVKNKSKSTRHHIAAGCLLHARLQLTGMVLHRCPSLQCTCDIEQANAVPAKMSLSYDPVTCQSFSD